MIRRSYNTIYILVGLIAIGLVMETLIKEEDINSGIVAAFSSVGFGTQSMGQARLSKREDQIIPTNDIQIIPEDSNGTKYIFFNRVPKAGSQSILALIREMSLVHDFDVYNGDAELRYAWVNLNSSEEANLTDKINNYTSLGRPFVFYRHTSFTNFTRNNYSMPTFINLVRDPIQRVISWFYYVRSSHRIVEAHTLWNEELPPTKWLLKDFEECYLNGDKECTYVKGSSKYNDHRSQAAFFCGHEENCMNFNDDWVVQRAKQNVERYYTVVGLTEEMDTTLKLFEHYLPKYFSGATETYYKHNLRNINYNKWKPIVSNETKNLMRKDFEAEFEFYEFCKQRLHLQAASVAQSTIK